MANREVKKVVPQKPGASQKEAQLDLFGPAKKGKK
jgi:hypothetical protein